MRRLLVVFIILLSPQFLYAQVNLNEKEKAIKIDFENLMNADSDSLKLSLCNKIQQTFQKILHEEESFAYPFAQLDKMGKLFSPDRTFRIYNWNCVLADGTYKYFGLIQRKQKEKINVEILEDNELKTEMESIHKSEDWIGALYYQIIPFKSKGQLAYLLLGWDGNNFITNKKIIEILSFTKDGKAQFGMPIISWRGKVLSRVVFEYAKQARMSLQYHEKEKRIVFDHLAPSSPRYQNQFEYYGPDFSYDALQYRKGKWELVENIDVRNR